MNTTEKVRIDKWLWSIRVFKSRTLATDSIKEGKVKINGTGAKPSATVTVNDIVSVKKEGFTFQFRVLQLIEKRVGAPIAMTCYQDITPEEEKMKYQAWFENGKALAAQRDRGAGRPTKKERRDIDRLQGPFFDDADDEE